MTELHMAADDLQLGDLVRLTNGQTVEAREIKRGDLGELIVNPGAVDQLTGRVWEHVTVTRTERGEDS